MSYSRWLPLFLGALGFAPGAASALTLTPDSVWPDSEIPVCWEEPQSQHRQERQLIRKAVRSTWERESAVSFTGWRSCRDGDRGLRIRIEESYPRTLQRGRALDGLEDGMVLPILWSFAALSVNLKTPVHEFGHALGFGHEHARPDAPDPERCGLTGDDGAIYVEADDPLTDFDTASIMVACVASATWQFSTGVPQLSALDIFGLTQTYGSDPRNILDQDEPGDRFGAALLLHDLDGNDTPDLAVGAPGEDDGAGAVYLYRGHPVKGFRPWARVAGADFAAAWNGDDRGFGASFEVREGEAGRYELLIGSERHAYRLKSNFNRPPVPDGRIESDRTVSQTLEGTDSAWPEGLERSALFSRIAGHDGPRILATADLNADGVTDTVMGLPAADGKAPGSGKVVVYLAAQGGDRSVPAAYWFGQAY